MSLTIPCEIKVIDVTLRDGLQSAEHYIPLDAKLYIAEKLIAAGLKHIEVGSISQIKYVPQFKDVDELLLALPQLKDVEYTVLALTPKAIERVGALLDKGAKIDRVLTGHIAVSAFYAMKIMRRTHDQLFKEAEENVKLLHNFGIKKVAGNIATIFGCPILGELNIEQAYGFVDRMFSIGFDEVEHSDTHGLATPKQIMEYFSVIMDRYPDSNKHSFHIHDYRGAGIAGYFAAMLMGVTTFDCSLGCTGGQPANFFDGVPINGTGEYLFNSRRTGLVSTEDFVTMLNSMKIITGVDEHRLYKLAQDLEKILGQTLTSLTSFITQYTK